jgi:hypothetical protein
MKTKFVLKSVMTATIVTVLSAHAMAADSSTGDESTLLVQPDIVAAPSDVRDLPDVIGKKLKDVIFDSGVDARTSHPVKQRPVEAPVVQAEPSVDARTSHPVKQRPVEAPVVQADPSVDARTSHPVKQRPVEAPVAQAEPSVDARTSHPVKQRPVEAPVVQADPSVDARTSHPVKQRPVEAPVAQADPSVDARTSHPVKQRPVEAPVVQADPSVDARTSHPVKQRPVEAPVAQADPSVDARTSHPVKQRPVEAPVVQADPSVDARTSHPVKQRSVEAPVAQAEPSVDARTSHEAKPHSSESNAVRCQRPMASGGVSGLQAFNSQLQEYDSSKLDDLDDLSANYMKEKETKPKQSVSAPQNDLVKKLWAAAKLEVRKAKCMRNGGPGLCRAEHMDPYGKDPRKALKKCLQGVRMVLEKVFPGKKMGVVGPNGRAFARNAGPNLKHFGYTKAAGLDPKHAPEGAIFIYKHEFDPGHPGHIEIKLPDGFYSDFYERGMINERPPMGFGAHRVLTEIWLPPSTGA